MTPARTPSAYHHGDARAALIGAALGLARTGGPDAVTLRAAARDVGITATAVYRHFAAVEDLLKAVKGRALALLAERVDQADQTDQTGAGAAAGRARAASVPARIQALAEAYAAFARESAGLFAMACHGGPGGVRDVLCARVDRALAVPAPPGFGIAVWCAVHGTALLAADDGRPAGPAQVLDVVLAGLRC